MSAESVAASAKAVETMILHLTDAIAKDMQCSMNEAKPIVSEMIHNICVNILESNTMGLGLSKNIDIITDKAKKALGYKPSPAVRALLADIIEQAETMRGGT